MITFRQTLITTVCALAVAATAAEACSRVTYDGPNNTVVTGRSMDWMVPLHTNLWAFPEGVARSGADGDNSVTWTSKYGSVIAAAYDAATTDGINEKGLVANLLYLSTAQYAPIDAKKQGLSVAAWPQYVLDNYATVDEAVAGLQASAFQVLPPAMPGGYAPTMHLSISDSSGDSAIFEYLDGKLVIHHDRKYQVMTNEPSFDQQLALNAYWKDIGGTAMLPGTDRPADRFVRASFYLGQSPKTDDTLGSVASMFSIMRNISVPMGPARPDAPNIAPTLWRTVSDQKNLVYYFESTTAPNVFWVNLHDINFAAGQPTKRLDVDTGKFYSGEVSKEFKQTEPFKFLPVQR